VAHQLDERAPAGYARGYPSGLAMTQTTCIDHPDAGKEAPPEVDGAETNEAAFAFISCDVTGRKASGGSCRSARSICPSSTSAPAR
jgi:hypothetical protein